MTCPRSHRTLRLVTVLVHPWHTSVVADSRVDVDQLAGPCTFPTRGIPTPGRGVSEMN